MGSGADTRVNDIPGNEKVKTQTTRNCLGKPPLDNLGIQALIGAFEIYGRIVAMQTRVEGMKIQNIVDKANGNSHPAYFRQDFWEAEADIGKCAEELQLMKTLNSVQGFE